MANQASWSYVSAVIANHVHEGHTHEDTVRRLYEKATGERLPQFIGTAAQIHVESWDLERLASLNRNEPPVREMPFATIDPPVVVRWQGKEARIDGRRRINELAKRGEPGPHAVLVIEFNA